MKILASVLVLFLVVGMMGIVTSKPNNLLDSQNSISDEQFPSSGGSISQRDLMKKGIKKKPSLRNKLREDRKAEVIKRVKKENHIGGGLLSEWTYDGVECVKRDLLSIPYLTKGDGIVNEGNSVVTLLNYAPEGYEWRSRLISGKQTAPYDKVTKSFVREPTCDKSRIDITPKFVNWWKVI